MNRVSNNTLNNTRDIMNNLNTDNNNIVEDNTFR